MLIFLLRGFSVSSPSLLPPLALGSFVSFTKSFPGVPLPDLQLLLASPSIQNLETIAVEVWCLKGACPIID